MKRRKILNLEDVSFSYKRNEPFLENVNFSIYENDFVGVVGPNGGGKTTLLKLILGLLKPDKGKITIFGKKPKRARTKIGYLPQFKNIDFEFPITAYEIVLLNRLGNKLIKKFNEEDKKAVKESMKRLKIWNLKDKTLNELSGGEKQRVFVARAISNNPEILLLDEPASNLDIHIQNDLYEMLKKLNKEIAIMIVEHNLNIVSKYAKEIVCINKCKSHSVKYHNSDSLYVEDLYNV
ncbi:MAG: metal ABC transporter ATP-binding protein [Candidatus Woesearchaeota archaeon]